MTSNQGAPKGADVVGEREGLRLPPCPSCGFQAQTYLDEATRLVRNLKVAKDCNDDLKAALATAEAQVEQAEKLRRTEYENWSVERDRRKRVEARLGVYREALEPLRLIALLVAEEEYQDHGLIPVRLTVSDLRRVDAALGEKP